jgi:hypothetical protein
MPITLGKLCENAENLYGMKLLAGSAGLDSFVRWVYAVEDTEKLSFLHGNELVLTTGIAHSGAKWLGDFVRHLHVNNAAGLVFNIGPYVDTLPRQVIDYCEDHGMPLFTVSRAESLSEMTFDFCHRIVTNEEKDADLVAALKSLIFEPSDDKEYNYTLPKCDFLQSAMYCVTAFHVMPQAENDADLQSLESLAQRILNKTGNPFSLFIQDKMLIAVLEDFSAKQIENFVSELRQSYDADHKGNRISAGISPAGAGYSFVTDGYHKAITALKVADARCESFLYFDSLDIYKLLAAVGNHRVLKEMYEESLGELERFDKENGTDYMDALRCYLEHNSSVQEVAQITFVHRNTINYKIRRIREILDCELTQENRLKFMLAFYIRDLL